MTSSWARGHLRTPESDAHTQRLEEAGERLTADAGHLASIALGLAGPAQPDGHRERARMLLHLAHDQLGGQAADVSTGAA